VVHLFIRETVDPFGLFPPKFLARDFAPIRREVREEFRDKDGYDVGHFTYGLVFGYNVKNVAANRIPHLEIRLLVDAYHHHIVSFKERGSARSRRPGSFDREKTRWDLDLKKAPHPFAAALLVDFLLSKEG
jgi:hypothetical protein